MRQQRIEVVEHLSENALIVDGDTEKLHQVLVNLLLNAIEAMPDGGIVTIDAELIEGPLRRLPAESDVNDQNDDRWVRVAIQDTGDGISNDLLSRLFEPFATTKERGTGLGLAVSHRIVEEHQGTIQASNRAEGGAQFTIRLPASIVVDTSRSG